MRASVTYVGVRRRALAEPAPGTLEVFVEDENGRRRRLRHVVHHSPTGMEASYAGSGPSDLALSMLVDLLHERPVRSGGRVKGERYVRAWGLHQEFKRDFIQGLPVEGWRLATRDIAAWIARKEEGRDQSSG